MAELNRQLRDLIDAAATPVTPDEIRSRTLHHLGTPTTGRHRRNRLLVAATLLLVALTGSLLIATVAGDDDGRTITDPTPDTDAGDIVEVVSDGVLYAVSDGRATSVDTPRTIVAASDAPPTRTTFGLIALTGMRDGKGQLIRIDQGQVTDIADDVYAFAVDPSGQLVAVARTSGIARDTGGRTTIEILDLATTTTTATVNYQAAPDESSNASPVGWAGPYVMVNLRDGGGSTAAYWRPGDASVTPIGPGAVLATDPSGPRAFIAIADSGCGTLFTILDGGGLTAEPPNPGTPTCAPNSISPDGTRGAAIDPVTRALTVRTLQPPSPPTTITDTAFTGNGDVAWLDNDRIAVASNGRLTICALPDSCTVATVPWTGPAPMIIVRDRRAADRTSTPNRIEGTLSTGERFILTDEAGGRLCLQLGDRNPDCGEDRQAPDRTNAYDAMLVVDDTPARVRTDYVLAYGRLPDDASTVTVTYADGSRSRAADAKIAGRLWAVPVPQYVSQASGEHSTIPFVVTYTVGGREQLAPSYFRRLRPDPGDPMCWHLMWAQVLERTGQEDPTALDALLTTVPADLRADAALLYGQAPSRSTGPAFEGPALQRLLTLQRRECSYPPNNADTGRAERPPLAHLGVAITSRSLVVLDTRSLTVTQEIDLAAVNADGRTRRPTFVAIAPGKNSAIITTTEDGTSRYALWTVDLGTETVTLLSSDAIWPSFSPDGTTLAYTRAQGSREGGNTIVLRDLPSGRERQLVRTGTTDALSRISTTVWSPDSRTFAYTYGYYGSDTYLIDVATATSLDTSRRLEKVGLVDWRESDVALAHWFCCFEAEPPVLSNYRISSGEHTPLGAPQTLGFLDRNDQDGRIAGRDESTGQYVMRFTNTDGELALLPGYLAFAW